MFLFASLFSIAQFISSGLGPYTIQVMHVILPCRVRSTNRITPSLLFVIENSEDGEEGEFTIFQPFDLAVENNPDLLSSGHGLLKTE